MTISLEQIASFRKAAQPLMDWLRENVHCHHEAIVDADSVQLVEMQAKCVSDKWVDPDG
jgi:hypothetical protein